MKFVTVISTLALSAAAFAGQAFAQTAPPEAEEGPALPTVSASFAFTNDYVFRGISQTFGRVAIQGSFDLTHTIAGLPVYAGAWASNVDFGTETDVEIDFYGGLKPKLAGLDFDLGFTYFYYPGSDAGFANGLDYVEFNGGVSKTLGKLPIGSKTSISPDFTLDSGLGVWWQGTAVAAVNKWLSVDGLLARQWVRENANFGAPDYTTWAFGATVSFPGTFLEGFSVDGRYLDTNLGSTAFPFADSRGVVTVKRVF